MTTLITVLVLLALGVALAALLRGRLHHPASGLPRAPFGGDAERDADLHRVLHDLYAH